MNIPAFYRYFVIFRQLLLQFINVRYYSIADLQNRTGTDGEKVLIDSYYANGLYPNAKIYGMKLVWDSTALKSTHNGVTIHSPTVPWDGTQAGLAAYQAKTGETAPGGSGCWVLQHPNDLYVEMAGATADGTTSDSGAFNKISSVLGALGGGTFTAPGKYYLGTDITLQDNVTMLGITGIPGQLLPVATSDYDASNSLLLVSSSATIRLFDSSSIGQFTIIRQGLTFPITDAVTAAAEIAAFAGTAITVQGFDAYIHHAFFLGFDKAILASSVARLKVEYVLGDCTNGIDMSTSLSIALLSNIHFWPFLVGNKSWVNDDLLVRNGIAFALSGQIDAARLTNCLEFGWVTGFSFSNCNHVTALGCFGEFPWSLGSALGAVAFKTDGTTSNLQLIDCLASAQGTAFLINTTRTDGRITAKLINCSTWASDDYHVRVQTGRAIIEGSTFSDGTGIGLQIDATSEGAEIDNSEYYNIGTTITGSGAGWAASKIGENIRYVDCTTPAAPKNELDNLTTVQTRTTEIYNNTSGAGLVELTKGARGTLAVPLASNNNDTVYRRTAYAYDGSAFGELGGYRISADGAPAAGSTPGKITLATTPAGSLTRADRVVLDNVGDFYPVTTGVSRSGKPANRWSSVATVNLDVSGVILNTPPVIKTANSAITTERVVINNKPGSTCIYTLPNPVNFPGRDIIILNYQNQLVESASANVIPITGGAATTAIIAATAGKWAKLVSDGANWLLVEAN